METINHFRIDSYCIGILKKSIFPNIVDYHTISTLRNEKGEQTDSQLSFVTVELDKFDKKSLDVKTDLDKLIYTMKTLHKVKSKRQFPEFWDEEWLKEAIQEVDRSAMSAEKRLAYEMLIARNAAVVHSEKKKVEKVIKNALMRGKLTLEEIAEDNDVSIDFVIEVKKKIDEK